MIRWEVELKPTKAAGSRRSLGNVTTSYTYNGFGELASKETRFNSTLVLKLEFARDSLGRITQKTETDQTDTTTHGYVYDSQGRLSQVFRNDTLTATYSYDQNGNRLAKITPTATDSGAYDSQDRMLTYGGATYEYSLYGDLQRKIEGEDTTHYVYDAFGSLVSVTMPNGTFIEYLLDGNGLRVGRKVNGAITQKWVYSNNLRIVAETDSADNIISRFVYTTSENVPEYMVKNDTLYRIATDQLGSVRRIVNVESGAIVQEVDLDEFGNVVEDSNPDITPFGFAGALLDGLAGTIRLGNRDFDPKTGRWFAKDALVFVGTSRNLYTYADSDPVNYSDPNGSQATDLQKKRLEHDLRKLAEEIAKNSRTAFVKGVQTQVPGPYTGVKPTGSSPIVVLASRLANVLVTLVFWSETISESSDKRKWEAQHPRIDPLPSNDKWLREFILQHAIAPVDATWQPIIPRSR